MVEKKLSLCIPTNGITEWVLPVIESIYTQNIDEEIYEIVITDNGTNEEFETAIREIQNEHNNLIYKKTDAVMFQNQIEAFKIATGTYIKFVNHRMKLVDGAMNHLISFVKENEESEPVTFFLNGVRVGEKISRMDSFDQFISYLGYWVSWSGGLGIWKNHFNKIDINKQFSVSFPHFDMLVAIRDAENYMIDNTKIFENIKIDEKKKGSYNLFRAFGYELVTLIQSLYDDGDILIDTFIHLKKDILEFVRILYFDYIVRRKECSYDLTDYEKYISIYFSKAEIIFGLPKVFAKKMIKQ